MKKWLTILSQHAKNCFQNLWKWLAILAVHWNSVYRVTIWKVQLQLQALVTITITGQVKLQLQAAVSPMQIKKKETWTGNEKPALRWSCMGWYRPCKILNNFSRIHLKLILLTLHVCTNLNCSFVLLIDYFQSLRNGTCICFIKKDIEWNL